MTKFFQTRSTLLILIFLLFRILFLKFSFWGLEYEDSFIYSDTGRFLNYSYDYNSTPFKCLSCIDGSFENCFEYASFGGHFLLFPILLSAFNQLIGYSYANIFFLNLIFSFLIVLVALLNWKYNKLQGQFSINTFIALMCFTPFITIFNTSGLAETISSFFVLGFLFSIYHSNLSNFKVRTISFWSSFIFIILAVFTKRENLVLLVFMYLIPLIRIFLNQSKIAKSYFILLGLSSIILIIFSFVIGIVGIENNEASEIGTRTFSFSLFVMNLKMLIYALLDYKYWGITGLIFFLSLFYSIQNRKINLLGSMSIIIILLYVIIYSSHYRSFYQVVYNDSDPFDTLRYATNYFPIVSIFISTIKFDLKWIYSLKMINTKLLNTPLIVILIFLSINVFNTRIEFSQDEYEVRIKPVQSVLKISNNSDIIISNITSVLRSYADPKQHLIDMYSLGQERFETIVDDYPSSDIFLLKPKEIKIDSMRYGFQFKTDRFEKVETTLYVYDILKFNKNEATNKR